MVTVRDLESKIFNFFHKTRLTHDIHFNLTVEETELLLDILLVKSKETKSE